MGTCALLSVGAQPAYSAAYTVSDLGNSGPGTLRQAILDANANSGADTINFTVAGTIAPATPLPDITDEVTIDAATAPGFATTPVVEINGAAVSGTFDAGFSIVTGGDGTEIRGFAINRFNELAQSGIHVNGASGVFILGNHLGTNLAGTSALGNVFGVFLEAASSTDVGGSVAADRNVISGNLSTGIFDWGGSSNRIIGNYIGTDASGTSALTNPFGMNLLADTTSVLPNTVGGTDPAYGNVISGNGNAITLNSQVSGAPGYEVIGNFIGVQADGVTPLPNSLGIDVAGALGYAPTTISENVIANHTYHGVGIEPGASGIHVSQNSIYANNLGIDLDRDFAVSPNDAGDGDTGANGLQNFPVITGTTAAIIEGSLDSTPDTSFDIELFRSTACDGSGNGEGEEYLGNGSVDTDALGHVDFSIGVASLDPGDVLTATATDPNGNTSEFSECFTIGGGGGGSLTVTNTNDAGNGSLRDAIDAANTTPGADAITFAVAGTIALTSELPTITEQVSIDARNAPGYSGAPVVELAGINAGGSADGFEIDSNGSSTVIRGLAINGFGGAGVRATGVDDIRISDNYIGTDLTGTSAIGNFLGILLEESTGALIGGSASPNVISGNGEGVWIRDGSGHSVLKNLIGTDVTGTVAVPNFVGVQLTGVTTGTSFNRIGDDDGDNGNVISGNSGQGVFVNNVSGASVAVNVIAGNLIGTAVDGVTPLGNGGAGVQAYNDLGASSNTVRRNTIAFNGQHGIEVWFGTSQWFLTENRIHSNTQLGIDLEGDDAVTPNDDGAGDADTGANELQNFPVITGATPDGDSTLVDATLDSTPDAGFTVEFFVNATCDGSGNGEGEEWIGSAEVSTDGDGIVDFQADLGVVLEAGDVITATASYSNLNTSEFSPCFTVGGGGGGTGTIVIEKQTDPDGDPTLFDFTTSYGPGFSLSDGMTNTAERTPGTYSVSEIVPPGWEQTSATCDDGSDPSDINLAADETVTCTFVNTKQQGNIIIQKATSPECDSTVFDFIADYDNDGFQLAGCEQNDSGPLDPGTYAVSEGTLPPGWVQTDTYCSDGSEADAIDLSAGETVYCTFYNDQQTTGNIVIAVETLPDGDSQLFDFTTDYSDPFSLSDGQSNDSGLLDAGTYSVSETVPAGWLLFDANCDDGSQVGNIDLQAGETVTCTFETRKKGNIIIQKETDPDGDPTVFNFQGDGIPPPFSLSDGQSYDTGPINPGSNYIVQEIDIPAGWELTSATCDDGSDPVCHRPRSR